MLKECVQNESANVSNFECTSNLLIHTTNGCYFESKKFGIKEFAHGKAYENWIETLLNTVCLCQVYFSLVYFSWPHKEDVNDIFVAKF